MKLSEINTQLIASMTPMEKWKLNCGGVADGRKYADAAILLGTSPEGALARAGAAAALYKEKRIRYIVASGGVKWTVGKEEMSEADYMTEVLLELGVPREAIIKDNEARSTMENMICSSLSISRHDLFYRTHSVIIVTDVTHMKRSLALARAFLPRELDISAYPSFPCESTDRWLEREENLRTLDFALLAMHELCENGVIDDMDLGTL